MNAWLVDTNVLLDVIGADPAHGERSRITLSRCAERGILVINPLIYGEVGAMIDSLEELEELLPESLFRRDPIPWNAAYLAGHAFRKYKRNGGSKPRMLADFLIGAHAAVAGIGLITRDRGYSTYFQLELLDPSQPA
ncbi:type II toxin-antitoxin system VapC family toxin [Endothiovibrio diazotrophicus]